MARAKAKSKKKTTRSRSRKKKNVISVDFEGVESGGGRPIADGYYTASITKIEEKEGESSGEPYLACQWKIGEEQKCAGARLYDNISLQPQSLWRFRTILECIGFEVEDGPMDIDPEDILEEECGIEVVNEEYDGKDKPRITGFLPASDIELQEPDEEEEEEEEYEEEEEEEPEEEEEYEEEEEEEKPKKKRGKKKKGSKKKTSRAKKPKKIRVGSKVKFTEEEGDTVKGVVTEIEDDTSWVEDSAGDTWEVDLDQLKAA